MSTNAQSSVDSFGPASTHPLVISPNLDALLEHEERIRAESLSSHQVLLQAVGPSLHLGGANHPVGLPPPPRGQKRSISPWPPRFESDKPISPTSIPANSSRMTTTDGEDLRIKSVTTEGTSSSSRTNPYINPAPTLKELGRGRELDVLKEAEAGGKKRSAGIREGQVSKIGECDKASGTALRPSGPDNILPQQPHGTPQRSHTRAVSLLDEKRPNRWRNIVDLFSDDVSSETIRVQSVESLSSPRSKANHEAELSKSRRGTGTMDNAMVNDDLVLDIRRHSNDFIDITNDECPRRPLDCHVSTHRASSSSATNSTIDSYTQILSVPDPCRHSFIEFFSPTTSNFPTSSDMFLFNNDTLPDSSSRPSKSSNPKNVFSIPTFKPSSQTKLSRDNSRHSGSSYGREGPPPTTNTLDMNERTDLVRKSRKLTRMFGETPGGEMLSTQEVSPLAINKCRKNNSNKESPLSIVPPSPGSSHSPAVPRRRHSIPVIPGELSESIYQSLLQSAVYSRTDLDILSDQSSDNFGYGSQTSFIDLSDEEGIDEEAISPISLAPNFTEICSRRPSSPSQLSLYEAMTPDQRAEEERRRKREKLAKLHRFLGSRVPTDLVLGVGHLESSLPPIQLSMPAEEPESRTQWLRRRRSSSAAVLPSWSDDVDRMKEELNDTEKAINVRRAQKMEKVFGVPPPQTLYHTRHSPSPSVPPELYLRKSKSPPKPSFGGFIPPGEVPSPTYQQRNPNRSSYIKHKSKRNSRFSAAESTRRLLSGGSSDCYSCEETPLNQSSYSQVYNHYQDSLKSLSDILDRDDKESLAELHQYINDMGAGASSSNREMQPPIKDRRLSNASSVKSERRRSLPARTSMTSVISEFSLSSSKPDVLDFQVRRRRAAKLTQFFGVNYRELINDVLESLETGLELERKRGTLRTEEVEDLLERLHKIRTDRKGFF